MDTADVITTSESTAKTKKVIRVSYPMKSLSDDDTSNRRIAFSSYTFELLSNVCASIKAIMEPVRAKIAEVTSAIKETITSSCGAFIDFVKEIVFWFKSRIGKLLNSIWKKRDHQHTFSYHFVVRCIISNINSISREYSRHSSVVRRMFLNPAYDRESSDNNVVLVF